MRSQTLLAKGLKRRAILAIRPHHQVNTGLIRPAAPLRLFDVREHLVLQHARAILDHSGQFAGLPGQSASRLHRINTCAVENHPIHFKSKQGVAVVPEIEPVLLRLEHFAPDIHVVTLDRPHFTAAHPYEVHDVRYRCCRSGKDLHRR